MSKRARDSITPVPKQQRVGDSHTPATSARPHGRVVLDVGGTKFVSSKTTLESASSYFAALLARWDENTDEPLFIDGDADAFQPLLSYMRFGTLTMPQADEGCCTRVLLQAEYLGMDTLLAEVKAQAFANLHPDTHQDEARPLADAFDEDVGSLAAAIRGKILPARYFAPAPKPAPEPPQWTIKALLPAAPGYRALFTMGNFDYGETRPIDGEQQFTGSESLHIVSWALVEYLDGRQTVDAVVQRDIGDTVHEDSIEYDAAHERSRSHIKLASEYRGRHGGYPPGQLHWLVIPPQAPGQMLPIPPGTVRGVWEQPAFTRDDIGKRLTVTGNTATVDGDARRVDWGDEGAPAFEITDGMIDDVTPWNENGSGIVIHQQDSVLEIAIPIIAGNGNLEVDLAFASVSKSCTGDAKIDMKTDFFMPIATNGPDKDSTTKLVNAKEVTFGEKRFKYFVGAKRS